MGRVRRVMSGGDDLPDKLTVPDTVRCALPAVLLHEVLHTYPYAFSELPHRAGGRI